MSDYRFTDSEKADENLQQSTTYGEGTARRASITDAVFGEITEDGPNYRAVRSHTWAVVERALLTSRRLDGRELPS